MILIGVCFGVCSGACLSYCVRRDLPRPRSRPRGFLIPSAAFQRVRKTGSGVRAAPAACAALWPFRRELRAGSAARVLGDLSAGCAALRRFPARQEDRQQRPSGPGSMCGPVTVQAARCASAGGCSGPLPFPRVKYPRENIHSAGGGRTGGGGGGGYAPPVKLAALFIFLIFFFFVFS